MNQRYADTPEEEDNLSRVVRALWKARRGEVLAQVEVLENAVRSLHDGNLSDEQRRLAEGEAHKLAGSAGTFGFPHGTVLAREIEGLLGGEGASPPVPRLRVLVAELRAELEADSIR